MKSKFVSVNFYNLLGYFILLFFLRKDVAGVKDISRSDSIDEKSRETIDYICFFSRTRDLI